MLHSAEELYTDLKKQNLGNWLQYYSQTILHCPEFSTELNALWGGGEMNPYDAAGIILNGWLTDVRTCVKNAANVKCGPLCFQGGMMVDGKPYSLRSYWHNFQNPHPNKDDIEASEILYNYAITQAKTLQQEYINRKEAKRLKRIEANKRRNAGEAGRGYRNVDKYGRDKIIETYIAKTGCDTIDIKNFVQWLYTDYRSHLL